MSLIGSTCLRLKGYLPHALFVRDVVKTAFRI